MSYLRSLSATLLSAAISFGLVSAGCGTTAIGIDECRDIEQARCRAAKSCGLIDDADACERYYRGHCLHGLPAKLQSGDSVASCIEVIEAAGRCAEPDPTVELADCSEPVATSKQGFTKACDVVVHPERTPECVFLSEQPEDEGSAGQSAGGQTATDSDDDADTAAGAGGVAVE